MNYLLRGKKSTVHVDRDRQKVSESHPRGSLNICGSFLLGFLWPIILTFLVHHTYLVYLGILPCVLMNLLAKMNSTAKDCG